jgi:hypothetical protein
VIEITAALPSRAQCERGSKTVHAARVQWVPYPLGADAEPGSTFPYPEPRSLCGAPVWGPYGSDQGSPGQHLDKVTCERCIGTVAWQISEGQGG